MKGYREVFKPAEEESTDPGRIFYTITREDIGKSSIKTMAGVIGLSDVIGYVQRIDVGKRLYRVPTNGGIEGQPVSWIWQAESDTQRDARLAKEGEK